MKNLLLFDFDNTIADTSEVAPNGVNVSIASEHGIRVALGEEGLRIYQETGGLRNREPREIVADTIKEAERLGIDLTKGRTLVQVRDEYVGAKMSQYEITRDWPKMFPGARDFFRDIELGALSIQVGIVSSGHHEFIKKVFTVNNLPTPRIVVSSDDIRSLREPRRLLHKPGTYLLAMAHRQYLKDGTADPTHDLSNDFIADSLGRRPALKDRIAYVGDDPEKDGKLARNCRIPYIYVPFSNPGYEPDELKGEIGIEGYDELRSIIEDNMESLREGASWTEVLVGLTDREVFSKTHLSERSGEVRLQGAAKERF